MEKLKHTLYVQCPRCKGRKKIDGEDCPKCHGTGRVLKLFTGFFNRKRTTL